MLSFLVMQCINTYGTFGDVIAKSPTTVQDTAKSLRALFVTIMPNITEVPWPKQKVIGYGVGPKKMSQHFCALGIYSKHVNLYFFHGAQLQDPTHILQGTGKNVRHIKLYSAQDIQPITTQFIKQAITHLQALR